MINSLTESWLVRQKYDMQSPTLRNEVRMVSRQDPVIAAKTGHMTHEIHTGTMRIPAVLSTISLVCQ